MDRLPLLIPALIILFCLAAGAGTVIRLRRLQAAWNAGITVPGRCVGAYVVTRRRQGAGSHTSRRHVYEFPGPDGRLVRFEETGGSPTVVPGDTVTVRHPAGHPDRATALPPSHTRGRVEAGCVLAFLGLIAAACAVFMVVYETQLREPTRTGSPSKHQEPAPFPSVPRGGAPELDQDGFPSLEP
ncbi:DUF3592 domain-containing protein [Streptomyces sp. NPDC090021]|uniref:DUF3592 domain-containing protein n=1 Tax=Streptomyces sp. NPDC090021 TaxID=3365919 RepID=UPI003825BDD6